MQKYDVESCARGAFFQTDFGRPVGSAEFARAPRLACVVKQGHISFDETDMGWIC